MAGYWPSSLFAFFMDRDKVEVHKDAKTKEILERKLEHCFLEAKSLL